MSLFPVFLDDASAGLKEVSGCIGLKCSFKSPFYIREWRKGLIKQSGTWKVIWMQLVISLNLCVFIMLRKHNYLGHFVLWRFTSHALTPNPKGCGPWLGSAVLDCFLPLVNGLENSALRGVSEGEEDEWDCKQKSERERDRERDGVSSISVHLFPRDTVVLEFEGVRTQQRGGRNSECEEKWGLGKLDMTQQNHTMTFSERSRSQKLQSYPFLCVWVEWSRPSKI